MLRAELAAWFASHSVIVSPEEVKRLVKAYGNPQLTLADYGYLLTRHPLAVWIAGELLGIQKLCGWIYGDAALKPSGSVLPGSSRRETGGLRIYVCAFGSSRTPSHA